MHAWIIESAYIASGLVCSGCACLSDLRTGRISNRVSYSGIALGVCLHFVLGGWRALCSAFTAGLLLGIFFFVFYAIGGMGAGDVKLGAAAGCLLGLPFLSPFLTGTTVSGAVLALAFMFVRTRAVAGFAAMRLGGFRAVCEPHGSGTRLTIPYALPMFLGCCSVLVGVTLKEAAR